MKTEEKLQRKMIKKAKRKHLKIYPCGIKSSLKECFTVFDECLFFWYNTRDKNTHVMIAPKYVDKIIIRNLDYRSEMVWKNESA